MKRLDIFLQKLRDRGFILRLSRQVELRNGEELLIYTVTKTNMARIKVVFHVYGEESGFSNYIEDVSNSMDDSIENIENAVKF